MATFNDNIREWRKKSTELKTWETFKIFQPGTQITMGSGNQHLKRDIHRRGVEHLHRTAPPTITASESIRFFKCNHTRNEEPEVRDGKNGTVQFSTYKLKLYSYDTIVKNNCNNERNSGTSQDPIFVINNKTKKEILLLELQEQILP